MPAHPAHVIEPQAQLIRLQSLKTLTRRNPKTAKLDTRPSAQCWHQMNATLSIGSELLSAWTVALWSWFRLPRLLWSRGDGYIEIHHCKPLSAGGLFDPQTDLVPVCSNCHRMIHRRRPWLSVEQLRQLVRSCGDQAAAANQVPGTRQRPGRS